MAKKSDSSTKTISKSNAARAAIKQGIESPNDAVSWIKKTYGIEMSAMHFSAIKSSDKKKSGLTVKLKRGPKPKSAATVAPTVKAVATETNLLAAMEAMKPLVASMGAAKVHRIIDLLK